MVPAAGNGTLQTLVERCRACRRPAEAYLAQLDRSTAQTADFAATLRCVAFLSVVADRLEAGGDCPIGVVDAAIGLARELADDTAGCAAACQAAADALSEWLDDGFERQ